MIELYPLSIHLDPRRESPMNRKENDNAVGRLGSTDHYELGYEGVYPMSEEASSNEPDAYDGEGENQELLFHYSDAIATLAATFFATIIVCLIVARMWDEDQIKLHVLDALVRLLQAIARLCGGWALECERAYNEHVNALH